MTVTHTSHKQTNERKMVGEGVEKKLYDAASTGDLATFQPLLRGNPYVLDGVSFAGSRNLLHIATIWGQPAIVEEVLAINPRLAEELDSQKSSPLHIAAAKGYVRIATRLLSVAPNMCWSRDCHGMNPIHIAAMNGNLEILKQLMEKDPTPAREKVGRGDTVMHLCVKHNQLEALEFLANKLGDLINEGDDNGDTVLHLAVRYKKVEIIEYLVESNKIDKKLRNGKGKTALRILNESRDPDTTSQSSQIREILTCKKSSYTLIKLDDVVMVVVILIATMAFQSVVSPPGGVWQDDSSTHKAGEAVMASRHPKIYKHFVRANIVAFVSSMISIILHTTKFPRTNDNVMVFTVCMTWVSLASISVSYGASVIVITPQTQTQSLNTVINLVITACVAPWVILYVLSFLQQMCKWFRAEVPKPFPNLVKFCTVNAGSTFPVFLLLQHCFFYCS